MMAVLTNENYVDKAESVMRQLGERIPLYELDAKGRKKKGVNGKLIIQKDSDGKWLFEENKFKYKLTSSKIRRLLTLTSSLYDDSNMKPFEELHDRIAYLRVQYVYQAGREKAVEDLVTKAQILEALKEVKDKDSLQRFCRYMEALVAYFKFYGGKD